MQRWFHVPSFRVVAACTLFSASALLLSDSLSSSAVYAAEESAAGASGDAKTPPRRLPPFFGRLVDGIQREKIYKVQDQFAPKIRAAEAQLRAVQNEMMAKIEQVLNDEQRKRLAAMRAAAQARRDAAQAAADAAGEMEEDADEEAAPAKP